MGTHFIYPLSPKGGYFFETAGGDALPITPDNYWASALKGAVDTWGLSTGFRILGPGDWVWAYFSLPTAQILGVGTGISPILWDTRNGRHAVDIEWDAGLTRELKRNPIDYARYQQRVQASAVRANPRTKAVLDSWLAQRGSNATQTHRAVEFATREVRQRLGQLGFRSAALRAYQNACAIT